MQIEVHQMADDELGAAVELLRMNFGEQAEFAGRELDQFVGDRRRPDHQYLVAKIDGTIIGGGGFVPDKNEDVEDVYWIAWLGVRPDYQRHGAGQRLLSETESRLKSLGARKLYADVGNESDQPGATAFYQKNGFVKEGEMTDYFTDGENMQIFGKRLLPKAE